MTPSWFLIPQLVKCSCYRPGVAQRVGRGIALLFHDRRTGRGCVVSSTPRPHFTPGKDPVPILQEAGLAPRPVRTDGKSRPHRDLIPDRPARSQSLYRLSYPVHMFFIYHPYFQQTYFIRPQVSVCPRDKYSQNNEIKKKLPYHF